MKICFIILFIIIIIPIVVCAQPLQNRILIATSSDGLVWTKLNQVFADNADVPDALIGPNGNVYVYYQGLWTPTQDGIMVAISADGLTNWTHYQVSIPGTQTWPGKSCDPDILVEGTTFRLYFTGEPNGDGSPESYSATSTDGINFTLESGIRFQIGGSMVLDPSLLKAGSTYQYFAGGAPPGYNWHAHSTNGLTFVQQPDFSAENLLMANGLSVTGGYRWYAFVSNQPTAGIRSLFATDGENWTVESGYRLEYDPANPYENHHVKDPAVAYKNSLYIMYYVSYKPLPGAVPDNDNYSGTPLTLSKSGSSLVLNWGQPGGGCYTFDYGIYRGSLPWSNYNHTSIQCSTTKLTTASIAADTGSYYYLVVAQSFDREGSYGLSSSNTQRPAASSPCRTQEIGICNEDWGSDLNFQQL